MLALTVSPPCTKAGGWAENMPQSVEPGLPHGGGAAEPEAEVRRTVRSHLNDVFFLDAQRGWAVGGGGLVFSTVDGGKSWSRHEIIQQDLFRITFANLQDGWIVGENGALLRTRDGGLSWVRRSAPAPGGYAAVRFVTPLVGWLVGDWILATRDAGRTWQHQGSGVAVIFNDIACASVQTCIVVGDSGTVLTTMDGGKSWKRQESTIQNEPLDRVLIARDGTSWTIGGDAKNRVLLRSGDLGQTWNIASDSFPIFPTTAHFWDRSRGVIAGNGIALTGDGGKTWVRVKNTPLIQAIYFLDERLGWAVGDLRTILHTRDGGRTWNVQNEERSAPRP